MRTLFGIIKLPYTAIRVAFGGRRRSEPVIQSAMDPVAPAEAPRKRGWLRKSAIVVGGISVIAGTGLLTIGVMNEISSGDDSTVQGEGIVLAYRDDPGAVYDRPIVVTPAPTATPAPTPVPAPAVFGAPAPPRESRYRMVIDSIGVNAGVFTYGLDGNAVPEVPLNGWDVAWYDFSSPPGGGSNAVFAGHVTWNGRAVFWDLPTLGAGAQIRLIANDGSELVYGVTESYLIDPHAPDAISVMLGTPDDVITIITCDGDPFFIGGSFGYDYTHRRVIRASLVNSHPGAVAEPVADPAAAQPAAAPEPETGG